MKFSIERPATEPTEQGNHERIHRQPPGLPGKPPACAEDEKQPKWADLFSSDLCGKEGTRIVADVEAETARLLALMPSDIKADAGGRNHNAGEIVAALKAQAEAEGGVDREDVSVFLAEMTRAVPLRVAFQRHEGCLMR